VKNIAKAIATFERTVVSGIAPLDKWVGGDEEAITTAAKRGFDLFNGKTNYVACHSGWNFTDDSFDDIGLPDDDIGRGKQVPNVKVMQHAFKTPALRNAVERAPYMHEGSLRNLHSVVRHYNDGFTKRESLSDQIYPLGLSDREQGDLVAFLKTLSSNDAPVAMPRLPAYDTRRLQAACPVSARLRGLQMAKHLRRTAATRCSLNGSPAQSKNEE
jgi:cytochrome c peroxidase